MAQQEDLEICAGRLPNFFPRGVFPNSVEDGEGKAQQYEGRVIFTSLNNKAVGNEFDAER